MLIIGDISGYYETFLALIEQVPGEEVISVGDMIDRGPKSKEVLSWFMKNGKALKGNHEHMLIDAYRHPRGDYYDMPSCYMMNGGFWTLQSFRVEKIKDIPEEYISWLEGLPMHMELEDLLISHAPKFKQFSIQECCDLGEGFRNQYASTWKVDHSFLWCRSDPAPYEKFQVFGHNSVKEPLLYSKEYEDGIFYRNWEKKKDNTNEDLAPYAICIDTANRGKCLTGLQWPSMKIYQQPIVYSETLDA